MANRRAYSDAAALPDGKFLVTGGQTYTKQFTDMNSILTPELWDPATEAWAVIAPGSVSRTTTPTPSSSQTVESPPEAAGCALMAGQKTFVRETAIIPMARYSSRRISSSATRELLDP